MKIGFVGAGNMGGAIAKRLISSKAIEPENMIIADLDESKTEVFKNECFYSKKCCGGCVMFRCCDTGGKAGCI